MNENHSDRCDLSPHECRIPKQRFSTLTNLTIVGVEIPFKVPRLNKAILEHNGNSTMSLMEWKPYSRSEKKSSEDLFELLYNAHHNNTKADCFAVY